ncbi:probable ATP-dependent RNA helicase DDX58 [Acetobacter orientalis]|uniref:Probable ATP-dependent RNA helicase DDX58 n=1 Tax=Acetobacter orientalis TaxID=146474 RepID=A0A2Z5ZFE0_9PROT|nr:probable ATP-dependent RNA helicase DDX58 [Acetobacter orientalis]
MNAQCCIFTLKEQGFFAREKSVEVCGVFTMAVSSQFLHAP